MCNFCVIICMNILLASISAQGIFWEARKGSWDSVGQILSLSHVRIVDWET